MTEGPIRAQTRYGAGLPVLPSRMALIELCVLVAVVLLEKFVEPFPDLSRMNPHPYWIFVLLLSLQYGTVSGLLAAIVSIIGTVVLGLPDADIGESYFEYLVRVWTQPVLWLVTALLLGSFRMHQIEFRDDLLREVEDLQTRGVALIDHVKHLKARCEAMERELAASQVPEARRSLDALARLASAQGGAIEGAFRAAMALAFPGAQASVFTGAPERWDLAFNSGWSSSARWQRSFASGDGLIAAIGGDIRSLSVLSARDEAALAGEGLFAVPIVRADTGAVIGLVKIESLAPEHVNAGVVDRLHLVARQLALVLAPDAAGLVGGSEAAPVAGARGGLAAAIRSLPRIRWRSGAAEASTPSVRAAEAVVDEAPAAGRSWLRRT